MLPTQLSAPLARYFLYPVEVTLGSKPTSREPVAAYAAEELDLSSPKVSDSCPCSSGFLGA